MSKKPNFNNRRERKDRYNVNGRIRSERVVIVGEEKKIIGTFTLKDALARANEADLDLVEIVPNSNPPICKIIDFGRFNYQQEKKKKEAKKLNKSVQLKEIKMRPKTDIHDYNFKIKHVREFIEKGNKVKITIRFKGREMAFINLGRQQIQKILEDTKDIAKISIPSKLEGRNLQMTISPLKKEKEGKKDAEIKNP